MHNVFLTLFALLALAIAVPLNINLGAYSPALVVGDGEISFTGKQDVATLMNALEGAAVSAAANNAAAAPAAAVVPAAEGAAEAKALAPAGNVPVPVSPASQDPNTAAIAAMQTGVGLGNDLEPRTSADIVSSSAKRDVHISKRDLSGFDRALNYATAALKTAPGVELGTGEGGSGVGIKQLPGGQAAVAKAGKRDLASATPLKRRNRVTTLLVRGIDFDDGKFASLHSG